MKRFEVTADHLKLLRAANVGWDSCEFGAPSIDCKRPYGNSDVYGDLAKILGIQAADADDVRFSDEDYDRMRRLHRETATVLQIGLWLGRFETGVYESENYGRDWRRVDP
jgi:hypothetical protein